MHGPPIDFRSDTVTKPTAEMRRAMAEAEVGDDVYGEDPTVTLLESRTAELLGKEAAVFVPSGTMANQIGVGVNTHPGDELLCSSTSHVYVWEAGGIARLSGVTARTFLGDGGILRLEDISAAIRPIHDAHYVRTRLVCLENTHNRGGGRVHSVEGIAQIARWARAHDLAMHFDGARLMNAVVASGHAASEIAQHFDTVSICFSKGLGAPVGSALAGSTDAIRRARRLRKLFGGGMRQAGILAAGALYALENHVDRLSEDHSNALLLADAFAANEGFELESGPVETNLVWVKVDPSVGTAAEVAAFLRSRNILVTVIGAQVLRACTHLDITREETEYAAGVIRDIEPALISAMTLVYSRDPMRSDSRNPGEPEPQTAPAAASRTATARPAFELFLISFLILFLELAWIRWLGSVVVFLTFFTNIVLMACFLGVSVGCLASARKFSWMNAFIPLAICAAASASAFLWIYERTGGVMIDVGSQQSPQVIYFGADLRLKDFSKWVIPIELLAGYFFALIALLFAALGQEMGRRFAAIENRLLSYSVDIFGSLAGIVAFAAMSYYRLPAYFWFAIALALGSYFVPRRRWLHACGALGAIALVFWADWPRDAYGVATEVVWSPYYQVRFKPRFMSIDVNNIGHQGMQRVDEQGAGYFLPHLLNRDSGQKPFEDVLIIGAGSGNDVAAALAQGARHVDACEIDPVLNEIGRRHHPNRPYSDPRVTIHLGDGRSFLHTTDKKYDAVIYALVDSLALHTSYSSVRLESFLFTEGAFRDIKARLKPGGVFIMYNWYRQGWLVCRLASLAERVFGSPPLVVSIPARAAIRADDSLRNYATYLLVGDPSSTAPASIRAKLAADQVFWLYRQPRFNLPTNGFGRSAPVKSAAAGTPYQIASVEVERAPREYVPTDDWPFPYLRQPTIPTLNLRGMTIVALLSLIILFIFAPVRRARPNAQMFFLGAGFMLLETKGVVHMALLFGSTWMVNSIVFFAILFMILVSNLYVLAVRPRRLWPYYLVLIAALLTNLLVPMDTFLALPGVSKVIASCAVVYLPVFFAGVIFATTFRSSVRPDIDFGSNVGGIILGGLTEYLSLIFGFNALVGIAIGYYALSALFGRRLGPISP